MSLTIESTHSLLGASEKRQLADALGDSPETALPVHLLRKGGGQVHLLGELPEFRAVIIEDYSVGPELMAYGSDVPGFCQLLNEIEAWDTLNVPGTIGPALAALIDQEMGLPNHVVDDIYQVPGGPIAVVAHPEVRMLTQADIGMLEATPDDIRDGFDDDLHAVLEEELIAGAIVSGQIVAAASTYGFQEPYADLAISTLADHRCRGYARAAASLVGAATQRAGRVPIWSCAPTNTASLAVAYKLGFREVSRRANIVLDAR